MRKRRTRGRRRRRRRRRFDGSFSLVRLVVPLLPVFASVFFACASEGGVRSSCCERLDRTGDGLVRVRSGAKRWRPSLAVVAGKGRSKSMPPPTRALQTASCVRVQGQRGGVRVRGQRGGWREPRALRREQDGERADLRTGERARARKQKRQSSSNRRQV